MGGEPFHRDGWGYVWSGAKATYGFTDGKLCYEVKLLDNMDSKLEKEKDLFELRVGWSTVDDSLQLGEDSNSFAYCGTAKKATDSKFEEYGAVFAKDDVVGAFIDLDGPNVVMTFTKNGESQGVAFEVPKDQLGGKALFPHIRSVLQRLFLTGDLSYSLLCDGDALIIQRFRSQ